MRFWIIQQQVDAVPWTVNSKKASIWKKKMSELDVDIVPELHNLKHLVGAVL